MPSRAWVGGGEKREGGRWEDGLELGTYHATSCSTLGLLVPFQTTVRVLLSVVVVTWNHAYSVLVLF